MKSEHFRLLPALFLVLSSAALASTTWYVNGVVGSDTNNCLSATTACKTIARAVQRASSGDSIRISVATYRENLSIGINLTLLGSGTDSTMIDGRLKGEVVSIVSTNAHVSLSRKWRSPMAKVESTTRVS